MQAQALFFKVSTASFSVNGKLQRKLFILCHASKPRNSVEVPICSFYLRGVERFFSYFKESLSLSLSSECTVTKKQFVTEEHAKDHLFSVWHKETCWPYTVQMPSVTQEFLI